MRSRNFFNSSTVFATLFLASVLLGGMLAPARASSDAAPPKRPNIVLILADDLGWADVGYHGSPIETPGIDRIAAEGIQLDHFYATPICSPTRAALMTGRDPMKLGIAYHALMPWHSHGLAFDEHVMAESFRDAGYQTALIGKWHLGHTVPDHHPNARGFDHFYGHLQTAVDYFDYRIQTGHDLQVNRKSIDGKGEYATFRAGREALRWIEARESDRPFFLYLPFLAPHNPMQAPKDLIEKYSAIPEQTPGHRPMERRINAAMIDAMDQMIHELLKTLDREGIANETLVIFLSDNGGSQANGSSNAPLRGFKGQTYEGGIRVVATMRWPGHLPKGGISQQRITVADVFPTLAGAAQIPMGAKKDLDGENLWPELSAGKEKKRKRDFFFTVENPVQGLYYNAILSQDWKLVQRVDQLLDRTEVKNELFDIRKDPGEKTDRAAQNPELVADFTDRIRAWRSQHPVGGTGTQLVPHPGWRPPHDWAEAMGALEGVINRDVPFEDLGMGLPQLPGLYQYFDRIYGERGRLIYK